MSETKPETCPECGKQMSPSALQGFPPVCPDFACRVRQRHRVQFAEGVADLVKIAAAPREDP